MKFITLRRLALSVLIALCAGLAACPSTEDPSQNTNVAEPDAGDPDASDPDANDPDADPDANDPDADPDANDPDANEEPDAEDIELDCADGDTLCESCDPMASPFGGGEGTDTDPWLICAAAHLKEIGASSAHLQGEYVLVVDLDLDGVDDLGMIGSPTNHFEGRFDGRSQELQNLTVHSSSGIAGFFVRIGDSGWVGNLHLLDVDIQGNDRLGGLAGHSSGIIEDVFMTGSVQREEDSSGSTGGLVGFNDGHIERAEVNMTVAGESSTGGLVGTNGGTIVDSRADGTVSGHFTVGGFVGEQWQGEILRSFTAVSVSGNFTVGGFAGAVRSEASIVESFATGDVLSADGASGGFTGRNDGTIQRSYTQSAVTSDSGYASGFTTGNFGTIEQSYSTSTVSADFEMHRGGLVVNSVSDGDVIHSYWNSEIGPDESEGGVPLNTAEFGDESSFHESWVFCPAADCAWEMPVGGPPVLEWQE